MTAGIVRDRQLKKREAQDRGLALYASGLTVADVCTRIGRTPQTWQAWRSEDWFAARADAIGHGVKAPAAGRMPTFVDFRLAMFGMDTFWHQKRIIEAVEAARNQEITVVLLPPEWGKSTVIEDWLCYQLGPVDPNLTYCLISESRTQSRKMLGRVQRRMTDEDSSYYEAYGPFRSLERLDQKPWNSDYMTIVRATIDQRDYSIEARGMGSKLYGSRYRTVLGDDVQSFQTLNETGKLLGFIRSDLMTRPGKAGGLVFVGTRCGPGDVYEAMFEIEGMVDHLVKIPALDDDGHSLFPAVYDAKGDRVIDDRGEPLGWTEEELAKRRDKVGEEVWARVYMQEPSSKVGAPFTEGRIRRALDYSHVMGDVERGQGTIASIDPALSGFASVKVARYDAEHLYLIDTANIPAPGRYEELFALVEKYSRLWQPSEWIFEVNAMQGGLARDDRVRALAEQYGFRVVEHTTRTNKFDTKIGVGAMADGFGRGEVIIPYGDEASQRQAAQLVKELRAWRPDVPTKMLRQDEVVSLWFIWKRWTEIKRTLTKADREIRIGGLPWTPTSLVGATA